MHITRNISYSFLFVIAVFLNSCVGPFGKKIEGDGVIVTEVLTLNPFNVFESNGSFDIDFHFGDLNEIRITADSNIQEIITAKVVNGKLEVSFEKKLNIRPSQKVKLSITTQVINSIIVNGSGNIVSEKIETSNKFKIKINGSGNFKGEVHAPDVETEISGSGDILLRGTCQSTSIKINGSAKIDAKELLSDAAIVSISGSGTIYVYARESIEANISGSGTIYLEGNPSKITKSISGSGKLVAI